MNIARSKIGQNISIGDVVAFAVVNYKRGIQRFGLVTEIVEIGPNDFVFTVVSEQNTSRRSGKELLLLDKEQIPHDEIIKLENRVSHLASKK